MPLVMSPEYSKNQFKIKSEIFDLKHFEEGVNFLQKLYKL